MVTIGILALQGDFAEHVNMLERCGTKPCLVKHAKDLSHIDGLIIPGGESTTIAKLIENNTDQLFDSIIKKAHDGLPVYGTCMGLIFLAKVIEGSTQGRLGLMDITVRRNAFGAQKFSREQNLVIKALGNDPMNLVFIRGPIIISAKPSVNILAEVEEGIVMCKQNNLLATAFHPELTQDTRAHQYFLNMITKSNSHSIKH